MYEKQSSLTYFNEVDSCCDTSAVNRETAYYQHQKMYQFIELMSLVRKISSIKDWILLLVFTPLGFTNSNGLEQYDIAHYSSLYLDSLTAMAWNITTLPKLTESDQPNTEEFYYG